MINEDDYSRFSQLKVVSIYGEQDIEQGWKLVRLFEGERLEPTWKETLNQYGSTVRCQDGAVVHRQAFMLLGRKRDEEIETLRAEATKNELELKKLREENTKLTVAKDALAKTTDTYRASIDQRDDLIEKERAKNRQLEGDIARVRTAVGELRMREILSDKRV